MVYRTAVIVLALLLGAFPWAAAPSLEVLAQPLDSVRIGSETIIDRSDYATAVLKDPWDMDQYSDVSQNLNESNVAIHLQAIEVKDSVFSATSVGSDAQFWALFPGYGNALRLGKTGAKHPIDSSNYHCLYINAKVDSADPTDELRVWWFGDERQAGGPFGVTKRTPLVPSAWNIYSFDLQTNFETQLAGLTPWNGRAQWEGLRIDPTTKPGVRFAVDWIRLTDCNPNMGSLSWSPVSGNLEIWAGRAAGQAQFRVAQGVPGSSGSYKFDTAGWEAGTYYIATRTPDGALHWSAQPVEIEPMPSVTFTNPSYQSGAGYDWDMNGPQDLDTNATRCLNYTFQDGLLHLTTQPPSNLPANCVGHAAGVPPMADPKLGLTMPAASIDTRLYRYLSMRVNTGGNWQDVNNGWVMRWAWLTRDYPTQQCWNVSDDIPVDVGWQTFTIDLGDPIDGAAEGFSGSPDCHLRSWKDAPSLALRLDPNELTLSQPLNQLIAWIRLTAPDRVAHGSRYQIKLTGNNTGNCSLKYYYTTDATKPTQHILVPAQDNSNDTVRLVETGKYRIYVPHIQNASQSTADTPITLSWDTTSVAPGQYYICANVIAGSMTTTTCSEVPVEIY